MRDPFGWSLPLGRVFGITVRVHILFVIVAIGLILRHAFHHEVGDPSGVWIDVAMLMGLLFVSVLLHEFGHCAGARLADGDASEILLWPLGGLASVDVPHTARANFITAVSGPLVNLGLCVLAGAFLFQLEHVRPPWNPLWNPYRQMELNSVVLNAWHGGDPRNVTSPFAVVLARLFYVNWVLFLLNTVVIGFPLDGGRMFQCLLWPRLGYHQATLMAVYVGFVVMLIIGMAAIVVNELLVMLLAMFIGVTCWRQWFLLVNGAEDSALGYDFSQGYTSLEREPVHRRKRPNFYQRWQQRRAARRLQREQDLREAEERRMDELLEKVQRFGLPALSDEERRFLKRVSDKYRNRQ